MPASAAKYIKNKQKKNSNQQKKLNFVLIQRDKILEIFLSLQTKLLLFQDYGVFLRCAKIEKYFWQSLNLKTANFFSSAILRCCKIRKKAFTQADRAIGNKQCYKHGR